MAVVVALAQPEFPAFWVVASTITAVLVFLNVLLLVAVHGRRIRQFVRGKRTRAFRVQIDQMLVALNPAASSHDHELLRRQVASFNELERPLAAVALIEHLQLASDEDRQNALEVMRHCGGIDLLMRSTGRWMPWRRALAVRTLGYAGADEAVPLLIERARSDRSRAVRESSVRALAKIGDRRAVELLGELFRTPGRVGAGVVYDALVTFGGDAEPIFLGALRSEIETVRVAACYGTVAVSDPETARQRIEPLLSDLEPTVRATAAEALGHVGGATLPQGLARATRDEFPAVRKAAAVALGSYDDPQAVELAVNALLDPERDAAIRAAESLVRLRRQPKAGASAAGALAAEAEAWPVERALAFEAIGAL